MIKLISKAEDDDANSVALASTGEPVAGPANVPLLPDPVPLLPLFNLQVAES